MKYCQVYSIKFCTLVLFFIGVQNSSYGQIPFEMLYGDPTFTDTNNNFTFRFDSGAKTMINTENGSKFCHPAFLNYNLSFNASKKLILRKKERLKIDVNGLGYINTFASKDIKNDNCATDIIFGKDIMHNKILQFNFKDKIFYYLDTLPTNELNDFIKIPIEKSFKKEYYLPLIINSIQDYYIIDLGFSGTLVTYKKKHFERSVTLDTEISNYGSNYIKELPVDTNAMVELGADRLSFRTNLFYMNPLYDNLIGIHFFSSFEEVIFDFKNLAIYLKNYRYSSYNFTENISIVSSEEDYYEVKTICRESKYYQNGIRLNQKLKIKNKELDNELKKVNECKASYIISEWLKNYELDTLFHIE